MVSSLIAAGARVEQVCLKKWTAVHEASRAGCAAVMELLLQNRGRVRETDQHGVTPLGIAAEYSHPEVLELLIKHGEPISPAPLKRLPVMGTDSDLTATVTQFVHAAESILCVSM